MLLDTFIGRQFEIDSVCISVYQADFYLEMTDVS